MSKKLHSPRPRHKRRDAIYLKKPRIIDEKPASPSPVRRLIDGYKDPTKVFHAGIDKAVRSHISRMKEHFHLPQCISSIVSPRTSDVLVINQDSRHRELLPDTPSRHVMLCHAHMARIIKSGVAIFSKITTSPDGSWALTPAGVDMLNRTTVQHVRRRPLWFLRRYSYEISFDGRVEPAMMLYDYGLDPSLSRQRFIVSTEKVQIRDTDKFNTFFRFWISKDNIQK